MSRAILMLEHDEDDRYIAKSFIEPNPFRVSIEFVTSTEDFWDYLNNVSTLPSIILLNYHTAPQSAIELISELKKSPALKHIPILVLSGTINDIIIKDCYRAGASSFIQKPSSEADTQTKISNFLNYWFDTVELR